MDNLIQNLNELTLDITNRLHEISYEELEYFVEERQQIIGLISTEVEICRPTPAQNQEIKRILEHDDAILARMDTLRIEAQEWLQKRNQAKAQRNAYEAGYSPESVLMDRKK